MAPRRIAFDYSLRFDRIDFRRRPDLYRIGRGEQGVLLVEPYKSELLPLWRFRTPAIARRSSAALLRRFRAYGRKRDFVGMDMARKFLQMGYTRARRYANYRGGRKYAGGRLLPRGNEPVKAGSAAVFHRAWRLAAADPTYAALRQRHLARHEAAKEA